MARDNWPDSRLDGLEEKTETNAEAITYLSLKVNTLEERMRILTDTLKEKATNRLSWWAILATVSNSMTAVIVYLISKGK